MKLKKNVVIVFFLIIFISLIGLYLYKNKDITLTTIKSNSKKYLISDKSGYSTNAYCTKYYEGVGTKVFKMSEVDEKYPMFIFDNCAVELDYYVNKVNNTEKTKACNAQKEYANNTIYSSEIKKYNDSCSEITGKLTDAGVCNWESNVENGSYAFEIFESGKCSLNTNPFKGQTRALLASAIKEEHPVYLVKGCAWGFSDIMKENSNPCINGNYKKNVCQATKDFLNGTTRKEEIKEYNDYCSGITGKLTAEPKEECKHFTKKTSGSYETKKFLYEPTYACLEDTNPFKGQTGVLASSAVKEKNRIYLVNGCSWAFKAIFANVDKNPCVTDDFKKTVCEEEKKYLEGSNNIAEINNYNSNCKNITGELTIDEYVLIKFNTYNSYGMECKTSVSNSNYSVVSSYKFNECIYAVKKSYIDSIPSKTITILKEDLPNVTNLKENLTGAKFNGWKRTSETNCNSKDSNLTLQISDTSLDEINYTSCFEAIEAKNSQSYIIYNSCDNTFTRKNQDETVAQKITGNPSDLNNISRVNSQIVTNKEFIVNNPYGQKLVSNQEGKFKINNYCKVSCTENFNYLYPTIFETIKSGTYFDLLSYPEASGSLKCTEVFSYGNWEANYITSIREERKAYVDMYNANKINSMNSMTFNASGTCGSYYNYYGVLQFYSYYSKKIEFLTYDNSTTYGDIVKTEKTYGYCESDSNGKNNAINQARIDMGINTSINYSSKLSTANADRVAMEQANKDCTNALFLPSTTPADDGYVNISAFNSNKNTEDFYKVDNASNMYFYYESDDDLLTKSNNLGLNEEYSQERLKATNKYVDDTGVIYQDGSELNLVNKTYDFKYDGCTNCVFNAKQTEQDTLFRSVTNKYIFDKSDTHQKYYSSMQTGKIVDETQRKDGDIYLGYVYPINLTLSGKRNVYFALDVKTNFTGGVSEILSNVPTNENDINVYKCDYDITNDIIIKDVKNDYKKNFYVRSISTSDVDPNDRIDKGQFGANWNNEKGKELIKIIEEKSKGNNTYNPKNLEYSFTLDALTIEAIREYNKDHKYSDFLMECNDVGGECKSKFLSNLAGLNASNRNLVDGIEVNNVNAIIKRNTWKYFINGSWLMSDSILSSEWKNALDFTAVSNSSFSSCINSSSAKKTYDCIYRNINEGVLP